MPICLFYGTTDALVTETNFQRLRDEVLPKQVDVGPLATQGAKLEIHKIPDYNHVDYLWAADANELVNTPLRKFLREVMAE